MHVNFKNSTGVPVLLPNTDIQHYDYFVNYFLLFFRHLSSKHRHNIVLLLSFLQKVQPGFRAKARGGSSDCSGSNR